MVQKVTISSHETSWNLFSNLQLDANNTESMETYQTASLKFEGLHKFIYEDINGSLKGGFFTLYLQFWVCWKTKTEYVSVKMIYFFFFFFFSFFFVSIQCFMFSLSKKKWSVKEWRNVAVNWRMFDFTGEFVYFIK